MNSLLEQYLIKKDKERNEQKNQMKYELLMREGLYEEIHIGSGKIESYKKSVRNQWNSVTRKYDYYHQVPIDISDEEYEEIKKVSAPIREESLDNVKSKISTAFGVFGYIVFLIGFISGIFVGFNFSEYHDSFNFVIALVSWIITFVFGTMLLGFAEVINLLEKIKKNTLK